MNASTGARVARLCLFVAGCWAGASGVAQAQWLPSEPIALADGRVTIGGDISASFGSMDPGFFNFTDYEHSELRKLRVNVSAIVKAGDHVSLVGDLLTENLDSIRPYAIYLRVRPWTNRAIDIQAGRVPPTFGAFARRTYVYDNPLIGSPLAYQYLTTLRPDSLPATTDELLQRRSLGWRVRYSIGDTEFDRGVPLVSAFRWDTGVQVHAALPSQKVSGTVSVTSGTISNPRFKDDNDGRQVAARAEARPIMGLIVGTSVAHGAFVATSALRSAGVAMMDQSFEQTAWGADLEYSRDYYVLRAETIVSSWRIPFAHQADAPDALRAYSTSIEGRYRLTPGVYAAARVDRLGFSTITSPQASAPWDAPVARLEVGAGFSLQRNLLLKISFQHNTRDGGRLAQSGNLGAGQLVFWF
jgi:hypothetical protein